MNIKSIWTSIREWVYEIILIIGSAVVILLCHVYAAFDGLHLRLENSLRAEMAAVLTGAVTVATVWLMRRTRKFFYNL